MKRSISNLKTRRPLKPLLKPPLLRIKHCACVISAQTSIQMSCIGLISVRGTLPQSVHIGTPSQPLVRLSSARICGFLDGKRGWMQQVCGSVALCSNVLSLRSAAFEILATEGLVNLASQSIHFVMSPCTLSASVCKWICMYADVLRVRAKVLRMQPANVRMCDTAHCVVLFRFMLLECMLCFGR